MQCHFCFCVTLETRIINQMKFHQCDQCGLVFKDELHLIDSNKELARYLEHNNEVEDVGYQNYFIQSIEQNIKPFINFKDYHILDFGSGPNPVLQHVFNNQYGVEISIFDKYFANDSKVLENTYDLITCIEVIEHIFDVRQIFNLFDRLLNKQGYLFIMTNFTTVDFKTNYETDTFSKWFYIRDITHMVFFSLKTFEFFASLYNYKIIHTNNKNAILFKKELK
jgi:hypothetical protein